jgi:hypothetical protein
MMNENKEIVQGMIEGFAEYFGSIEITENLLKKDSGTVNYETVRIFKFKKGGKASFKK